MLNNDSIHENESQGYSLRVSHKEDSLHWLGGKQSCELKVFLKYL